MLPPTYRHLLNQRLAHERPVVGVSGLFEGRLDGIKTTAGSFRSTTSLFPGNPLGVTTRLVDSLGRLKHLGHLRGDAHRQVALPQRHDGGQHRVGGTISSEVVDVGAKRFPGFDCRPHGEECRTGHHRVTNNVMRRSDEVIPGVPGDVYENRVGFLYDPFGIGSREEDLFRLDDTVLSGRFRSRHGPPWSVCVCVVQGSPRHLTMYIVAAATAQRPEDFPVRRIVV